MSSSTLTPQALVHFALFIKWHGCRCCATLELGHGVILSQFAKPRWFQLVNCGYATEWLNDLEDGLLCDLSRAFRGPCYLGVAVGFLFHEEVVAQARVLTL